MALRNVVSALELSIGYLPENQAEEEFMIVNTSGGVFL